jgi:hypothetical protein
MTVLLQSQTEAIQCSSQSGQAGFQFAKLSEFVKFVEFGIEMFQDQIGTGTVQ